MPYLDDPSIKDKDALLRRVPMQPGRQIIWDGNLGRWRPSSAAFKNHPDKSPMSVTLQTELDNRGLPARLALIGYESTHVLATFPAGVARQYDQGVAREPETIVPVNPGQNTELDSQREILPEPAIKIVQDAHAVVFGKKTQKVRDALVKAATWVVAPTIDP